MKLLILPNFSRILYTALVCISLHHPAYAAQKNTSSRVKEGRCYEIYDPNELSNRSAFNMNIAIYQNLIDPPLTLYNTAIPSVLRQRVDSFLGNLQLPLTFVNNILQGDSTEASKTLGRFITNSTIGIFGLFDVASGFGVDYRKQTFAETLAYYGAPYGEFSIKPILGPSTSRSFIGSLLDFFFDPVTLILGHNYEIFKQPYYSLIHNVDKLQQHNDLINNFALDGVDPYVKFRNTYIQYIAKQDPNCANINQVNYQDE